MNIEQLSLSVKAELRAVMVMYKDSVTHKKMATQFSFNNFITMMGDFLVFVCIHFQFLLETE